MAAGCGTAASRRAPRVAGTVELKFCITSAVLRDVGAEWVKSNKHRGNYQGAVRTAVEVAVLGHQPA